MNFGHRKRDTKCFEPFCPCQKTDKFRLVGFFIQADRLGISSARQGCISSARLCRVVSHHTEGVHLCRLDDIQNYVLMIYNFYEIDDIHGLRRDSLNTFVDNLSRNEFWAPQEGHKVFRAPKKLHNISRHPVYHLRIEHRIKFKDSSG